MTLATVCSLPLGSNLALGGKALILRFAAFYFFILEAVARQSTRNKAYILSLDAQLQR